MTTPQILLTRNTSVIPGTTPTVNQDENVDTITIILVAVVFVVVLITCLVLGFREQKNRQEQEQLSKLWHFIEEQKHQGHVSLGSHKFTS